MKRLLILTLVLSFLLVVTFSATACDKDETKNAYDIAVENGFEGSVEDWLISLRGDDGEKGNAGKSAYEIAVENGFTGSIEDWLLSLKGIDGTNGTNGVNGTNGTNGVNGTNGTNGVNGTNGANGLSAYDIAVENGFNGSIEDWLESLSVHTAQITLSQDGNWLLGTLGIGLNINDTTNIVFKQQDESLLGTLIINVAFFGAFEKVEYSVFREGLTVAGTEYIDYITENKLLEQSLVMEDLEAPYFGNYQIKLNYYNNDAIVYSHKINGINFQASHYNFVYSNSTMPVLYSSSEIVTLDHSAPTYIAIARATTFNWGHLPENCYAIPNSKFTTATTKLALFNDNGDEKTTAYQTLQNGSWGAIYANSSQVTLALKQIKHWIGDLYSMNNSSTFTFYVDDTISNVALWLTYGNNLPTTNFEIVMYTEGASTASWIPNNGLGTYAQWQTLRNSYLSYIEALKGGLEITTIWQTKWSFVMNADDNVTHIVNTKTSLLNQLNPSAANYELYKQMMSSNLVQYTIGDALNKVELAGKTEELEFLLRTRWLDSDDEIGSAGIYFETSNGKKNLMIIGTSPSAEINSNGCGEGTTLMSFMGYLVSTYGDEYNIFYKGHPSYPIKNFSDGRATYFANNNIIVLPNAVPAETYMYLYDDVYIGGYYSSTMISSMVDQTIFFFGTEPRITAQAAIAPFFDETDPDYLGIFENTVFITIDSIQP